MKVNFLSDKYIMNIFFDSVSGLCIFIFKYHLFIIDGFLKSRSFFVIVTILILLFAFLLQFVVLCSTYKIFAYMKIFSYDFFQRFYSLALFLNMLTQSILPVQFFIFSTFRTTFHCFLPFFMLMHHLSILLLFLWV